MAERNQDKQEVLLYCDISEAESVGNLNYKLNVFTKTVNNSVQSFLGLRSIALTNHNTFGSGIEEFFEIVGYIF